MAAIAAPRLGIADVAVVIEAQPVGREREREHVLLEQPPLQAGAFALRPLDEQHVVSTRRRVDLAAGQRASACASRRAAARGSSASRSTRWSSAKWPRREDPDLPHSPPPSALRIRRARPIASREPTTMERRDSRAVREAEREQVDLLGVASATGTFEATLALKRRAPSRWTLSPRRSASAAPPASSRAGTTRPRAA